ncbi:hypothetical protein AM592_12305 [Bacillus gobiensis]|uniref:Uncharacterized protein n=2 Tax=Bacillus TaxID=1386 RepID=A0A0M4FHN6_9BACI|nr:hypothetical protein AM592_12305 [Bacillus gobiensis]MBP1081130.1 hypothetical protein [Bacillus capparidis]
MKKLNIALTLIILAILAIGIFGGTFIVQYIRTGIFLIDQILGTIFSIALLVTSLLCRKARSRLLR